MQVIANNRRAYHDYFILERYHAGLILLGSEVKSLRLGMISLQESFVQAKDEQLWLVNARIAPYEHAAQENHLPNRARCLLLRKREKNRLRTRSQQKVMTIVPLQIFFNDRGLAKVTIALVRGKKQHDKRRDIMRRSWERQKARVMKGLS